MTPQERWNRVVTAITNDIEGFEVKFKDESNFHKLLGRLSIWSWSRNNEGQRTYGYMDMTTTMGNKVWFPSNEYVSQTLPSQTLEHEWVHMKDGQTFFGWLPFIPAFINRTMMNIMYIGCLPWPGFVRAYAEIRAYRRSLELVEDERRETYKSWVIEQFTGPSYFFMWPFRSHIERLLEDPSPYREEMDKATR